MVVRLIESLRGVLDFVMIHCDSRRAYHKEKEICVRPVITNLIRHHFFFESRTKSGFEQLGTEMIFKRNPIPQTAQHS